MRNFSETGEINLKVDILNELLKLTLVSIGFDMRIRNSLVKGEFLS